MSMSKTIVLRISEEEYDIIMASITMNRTKSRKFDLPLVEKLNHLVSKLYKQGKS